MPGSTGVSRTSVADGDTFILSRNEQSDALLHELGYEPGCVSGQYFGNHERMILYKMSVHVISEVLLEADRNHLLKQIQPLVCKDGRIVPLIANEIPNLVAGGSVS
jgi:hypothetical protein